MLVSGQVLHYHDGVYRLRTELIPFLDPRSPVYAQWLESECKYRQYWADSGSFFKDSDIQNTGLLDSRRYKRHEIISMGVQSLLGRLQGIVQILKDYPRFFSSRRLLDLGGGHGLIGIACAQANPGMKVVIFDKPDVVHIAWEHVCMSGIADRIVCIGGDYLQDSIGSKYDIILHICPTDFPSNIDYQVIQIVRAALSQKGLYVRCGFFLDDNCHGPLLTTSFALAAEMRGEKRHRTIPEFRKMVYDAGHVLKTSDVSPSSGIPVVCLWVNPPIPDEQDRFRVSLHTMHEGFRHENGIYRLLRLLLTATAEWEHFPRRAYHHILPDILLRFHQE